MHFIYKSKKLRIAIATNGFSCLKSWVEFDLPKIEKPG